MCVTSRLLCGPWADLWPFYGLYCKRFSLYIEVHTQVAQARQTSALLCNIPNIRICTGKKPIVSVTYEKERISIKKQLTLHKMCVTSLLCGPWADLWPFYGFLCKRFSLYIKVFFPYKSLYFECYATMPMLADAHISSLGYL